MPFCPECRYEYTAGSTRCPDCDTDLVEALPHDKPVSGLRFVPLPGLPGRVYAEMVREVLDQEGIPCYLRSDGLIDSYGISGTGPANRGVRIFVPEDALEEAVRIQRQMMDHI
ncbi:MAG TPA: DUF2007 domain-containing protein [bacterium]|nr:DUF2007 domain-containing protein [bacterium]